MSMLYQIVLLFVLHAAFSDLKQAYGLNILFWGTVVPSLYTWDVHLSINDMWKENIWLENKMLTRGHSGIVWCSGRSSTIGHVRLLISLRCTPSGVKFWPIAAPAATDPDCSWLESWLAVDPEMQKVSSCACPCTTGSCWLSTGILQTQTVKVCISSFLHFLPIHF